MNAQSLSRRGVVAALAALPTLSLAALVTTAPDPILAVIEVHRRAFLRRLELESICSATDDDHPSYPEKALAMEAAYGVERDAELNLITTPIQTIAGALALLKYADDFCTQQLVLPSDPRGWHSSYEMLREFSDAEVVDRFSGKPINLPLVSWVVRNSYHALVELTATAI